jgi:hypothetical protein
MLFGKFQIREPNFRKFKTSGSISSLGKTQTPLSLPFTTPMPFTSVLASFGAGAGAADLAF